MTRCAIPVTIDFSSLSFDCEGGGQLTSVFLVDTIRSVRHGDDGRTAAQPTAARTANAGTACRSKAFAARNICTGVVECPKSSLYKDFADLRDINIYNECSLFLCLFCSQVFKATKQDIKAY